MHQQNVVGMNMDIKEVGITGEAVLWTLFDFSVDCRSAELGQASGAGRLKENRQTAVTAIDLAHARPAAAESPYQPHDRRRNRCAADDTHEYSYVRIILL